MTVLQEHAFIKNRRETEHCRALQTLLKHRGGMLQTASTTQYCSVNYLLKVQQQKSKRKEHFCNFLSLAYRYAQCQSGLIKNSHRLSFLIVRNYRNNLNDNWNLEYKQQHRCILKSNYCVKNRIYAVPLKLIVC